MTRRSSLTVTYSSLQDFAEEVLKEARIRYAGAQARGTGSLEPLKARVANAETLVKMLKKCERGKQADLFANFNEVQR